MPDAFSEVCDFDDPACREKEVGRRSGNKACGVALLVGTSAVAGRSNRKCALQARSPKPGSRRSTRCS